MKTLSSDDAFFLHFETPDQQQHTVGTMVLDPATAPGHCDIETLVGRLDRCVSVKPEFTQKLVDTAFSMTAPVLVEDPDYNYDNHIRRIGLPAPGTIGELASIVGDIASTPLDHRRPLWECWFISGLEGGRLAMVFKSHHCLADAANGAEMMADLYEAEPESVAAGSQITASAPRSAKPPPLWQVTYEALKSRRRHQSGYLDIARRTVHSVRQRRSLFAGSKTISEFVPEFMESAPKLKFNKPISSNRSVALGTLSLLDVKTIKNVLGVTVNDVIVTACTMALREYLIATDDLPDKALIGYVPVSLILKGQRAEKADQGNQIGTMAIRLPVHLDDTEKMIAAIHDSTVSAKQVFEKSFENLFQKFVGALPPRLAGSAMKLYASPGVIERAPTSCNVVISNIPSSQTPLYIAGAKMESTFPMGAVISGQGLNITLMSYVDKFDFSVQACRDHMPDPWQLSDAIIAAVDTLSEFAALKSGEKPATAKRVAAAVPASKPRAKKTGKRSASLKTKAKPAAKTRTTTALKSKVKPAAKPKAKPAAKTKAKSAAKSKVKPATKTKAKRKVSAAAKTGK